jgi:hypothetical protein
MSLRDLEYRGGFVVSSGRCGSTLLTKILGAHPGVLSLSEFFTTIGGRRVFEWGETDGAQLWALFSRVDPDISRILERHRVPELLLEVESFGFAETSALSLVTLPQVSDAPAALLEEIRGEVSTYQRAPVGELLTRFFEWFRTRLARDLWVERSGGSIEYLDCFQACWPAAKYVYLLRDGVDCACSMARHPFFRVRVARIVSRDPTLSVEQCLRRTIEIDRFGAYWSALVVRMKHLMRQGDPESMIVLRYEDLISDLRPGLERLRHLFRLGDSYSEWESAASAKVMPADGSAVSQLSSKERLSLERACRPGMRIVSELTAIGRS